MKAQKQIDHKLRILLYVLLKYFILFLVGGTIYVCLELIFRGHSNWTMLILGGLCFVYIGGLNNWFDYNMSLIKQMSISAVIITVLEYICGYIVNIKLGWNVWDYSDMPFNIQGQICLPFTILWFFLSALAIILDDYLRHLWFNEDIPHYKLWHS